MQDLKSYLKISKIENFEDWVIDKFEVNYLIISLKIILKVGELTVVTLVKIGQQRIKGLSLSTAIKFALFPNSKKRPKTLVDLFYYPKLGAGMLWEKFEDNLISKNIEIRKNSKVTSVDKIDNHLNIEIISNESTETIRAGHRMFSNPLLEFIKFYDDNVPDKVLTASKDLSYRNHISVHVTIDKKLFDDNWIYIHSPELKMARIADFTNFSKSMSVDGHFPLTLEYFCFEDDTIWKNSNEKITEFAISELKIIFEDHFNVIHSEVTRNANAYPVIKTGYEKNISVIRNWLSSVDNITAIGRSGMFKYNNQDHAMATGLYAVRDYMGQGSFDPWEVNIDGEYHEEISDN